MIGPGDKTAEFIDPGVPPRYEVLSSLGEGAMGRVYHCRDSETEVEVAIKVISPRYASDPTSLESIRNEAKAHMRLRGHPNILTVYAFEQHGEGWYLVMDFAAGGTLFHRLKAAKKLPEAECRRIGAEVASGLHWAHKNRVLHRDIKPANILMDGSGRAMIADFGIAKVLLAEQESTSTIHISGTAAYLPPEAILRSPLDYRFDLYSLGCMLFEMATGRRPYGGTVDDILRAKVVDGVPVPDPREFAPELSEDFAAIIKKATATVPADRYADAAAFAEALRGGVPEDPAISEATLTKIVGGEGLPVAAAPAPAAAVAAAPPAAAAPPPPAPVSAPSGGIPKAAIFGGAGVLVVGGILAFVLFGRGGNEAPSPPVKPPAPAPGPGPAPAPAPSVGGKPAADPNPPSTAGTPKQPEPGTAGGSAPAPSPAPGPATAPEAPPKQEPFRFAVTLDEPKSHASPSLTLPKGFRWEGTRIACEMDRSEMVLVPQGEFTMGSEDGEEGAYPDEHPRHQVRLGAYLIDRHEVTLGQFREFSKATGRTVPDQKESADDRNPVVNLNYDDAKAYAAWAGKRLPTEAEWERAARGTEGLRFPWGKDLDPAACNAEGGQEDGVPGLAPCGSFPRDLSPAGCFDMAGNASEWCSDWYDEAAYAAAASGASGEPGKGKFRVVRGGNYTLKPAFARLAGRNYLPEAKSTFKPVGLRCVRSIP